MTDIQIPDARDILQRISTEMRKSREFEALDLPEVNLGVRYDLTVDQRQIGWDAQHAWCEENIGPEGQGWHKYHWRYKFADPIRAAQFKLIFHSDKATDPEAKYR
jgi:hypothetical protein